MLIPQVRLELIVFGETIVRRALNRDVWHQHLQLMAVEGFLLFGFVLFCVFIRSNAIPAKIRNAVLAFSCIGIAGCLGMLIPQVRLELIVFGESVVRRALNKDVWNLQLQLMAVEGFLLFGFMLFRSKKFSDLFFRFGKKYAYPIEVFLACIFLLETIILAAVNQSLWMDEVFSLATIRLPWQEVIRMQIADVHPPFYFIVLKLCADIFGDNIFTMKMVSVLPSILTLISVTIFLNKECSPKNGCFFLLCCIASESVIYYSVEIRMYSWAFFFVTMTAISAWYIIKNGGGGGGIFAAFRGFAEGAAYTHIYAGLTAGIGYLLLLGYTLKYDRKKLIKIVTLAPLAVLFYLPWLFIIIASFIRVATNDLWIPPITLKTIAEYGLFIFNAGDFFMTLFFLLLFLTVLVFFFKKAKTKIEYFAFAGFSCIILLAGLGIAVSFAIRPVLINRYLFPACGLVWLFFAIVGGSLQNRKAVFVTVLLLILSGSTFLTSLFQERKQNSDFTQFYHYLKDEIRPQDIFIYSPESGHLQGISAFLFPGHTQLYKRNSTVFYDSFMSAVDTTLVDYADLSRFYGSRAWIFVSYKDEETFIPPESVAEFRGDFGWFFYQFKLYYTESLSNLEIIP
jgi:hypothetical protein